MKRAKPVLLRADQAGNKLYGLNKANGTYQLFVKNAKGELVNYPETRLLIKRMGLGGLLGRKISERKRGKTTFTKIPHKTEIKGRKK